MAEHDLTQKLIPYLDRHLAIPLLNHLSEIAIFPSTQVIKAQYDLVTGTNMVDYAQSVREQLESEGVSIEGKDFASLREKATARYNELKDKAQPVIQVIEDPEAIAKLKSGSDRDKNLDMLRQEYNIDIDQINALYHFGQYQFSIGLYAEAANFLYHFLLFSPSYDLNISAHWGKLAADILSGQWESALTEVKDLRDAIDNSGRPIAQLQARAWLLHWSLFVFFNLEGGHAGLLDMFLSPAYLNTIQTSCPHLLRYVVAAAIISRRPQTRRDPIKELVRIVQTEEYHYSDPITGFLKDLYCDFDFDRAQQRLAVADNVVQSDFFLSESSSEFMENARWLVSEVFCRIHQRIDIKDLSKTLNMSHDEGEKWIVNLIRDSRMGVEAKIDLKSNMLHITRPYSTPTASLIETTRGLAFRSQAVQYAMASNGGEAKRRAVKA